MGRKSLHFWSQKTVISGHKIVVSQGAHAEGHLTTGGQETGTFLEPLKTRNFTVFGYFPEFTGISALSQPGLGAVLSVLS